MNRKIPIVEDNPDDAKLTLRAFQLHNLSNEIVAVKDGVEALDYLFGTGSYAGRDVNELNAAPRRSRCRS